MRIWVDVLLNNYFNNYVDTNLSICKSFWSEGLLRFVDYWA